MIQLRPYQEILATQGRDIITVSGLVYYAMEVRTGKTLTALRCADLSGASDVLFVTKKKAVQSIINDYEALAPGYKINVTTFESLHHFVDRNITTTKSGAEKITYAVREAAKRYDFFIIDEAHTCGAFPSLSLRTEQLQHLVGEWPCAFLSGTPTPESYSQLFHQLAISKRSPWAEYTSFYKWAKEYVTVKKRYAYNREFNDYSDADIDRIKSDTAHIMLSYSQEEAGFVQLVQEEVMLVRMKPATYKLANTIIKDKVYIGNNGLTVTADTAVKEQNKVHQIYSGTVITDDKTPVPFDHSKALAIKDRFAGKKIAIFYKFDAEGQLLRQHFDATASPEEFNASSDKVFVCQVQSGREGVNLSTADYLIMYNIDFSALSYWQARARMQTKDRQTDAIVVWVFAEGGIEQKIYDTVLGKKDYTLTHYKKDYAGIRDSNEDKRVAAEKRMVRSQDHPVERKRVS